LEECFNYRQDVVVLKNTRGGLMITIDDVAQLRPKNWVRLECKRRESFGLEGIYTAGGIVIGQYTPDTYYQYRYKLPVVTVLDPSLNGKAFIVLLEDIECLSIIRTSVPDD
jgi:hypothetical protein